MRMAVSVGAASVLHVAVAGALALFGGAAIDRGWGGWRTHARAPIELTALVHRAPPAFAPSVFAVSAGLPPIASPSHDRARHGGRSAAPFHADPALGTATDGRAERAPAVEPPSVSAAAASAIKAPGSVSVASPSVNVGPLGSMAVAAPSGASVEGSGYGASGGEEGDPRGSRATSGRRTLQLAELAARIRAHRHYPELARRRGVEGTVLLRFSIRPDGGVAALEVIEGVDPALDEAARDAVLAATPLPPVEGTITVPMPFRLHDQENR